jgi:hypothetical protein
METAIGITLVVVWCGLGFVGAIIRAEKGYEGDSCAVVLYGGPLYFWVFGRISG